MNQEEKREVARAILVTLYESWEKHQLHPSLETLRAENNWSEALFNTVLDQLENEKGLIARYSSYYTCDITVNGILFVEDKKLVSDEKIKEHESLRRYILEFLTNVYEEEGIDADAHYHKIIENAPLGETEISVEVDHLKSLGLIIDTSTSSFAITNEGLKAYKGEDYFDDIV